jgi:hypothetical protein
MASRSWVSRASRRRRRSRGSTMPPAAPRSPMTAWVSQPTSRRPSNSGFSRRPFAPARERSAALAESHRRLCRRGDHERSPDRAAQRPTARQLARRSPRRGRRRPSPSPPSHLDRADHRETRPPSTLLPVAADRGRPHPSVLGETGSLKDRERAATASGAVEQRLHHRDCILWCLRGRNVDIDPAGTARKRSGIPNHNPNSRPHSEAAELAKCRSRFADACRFQEHAQEKKFSPPCRRLRIRKNP